jgi:drug/metabolite transporter (DMT)-like permease
MKINKRFILSFVAPFMILISAVGMIFRDNSRKIFYLPIGVMGVVIILERGMSRQLDRKNILKKIKSYKKAK